MTRRALQPADNRIPDFPSAAVLVLFALASVAAVTAAPAEDSSDVLISVNGEPITAADMDRMIMEAHASMVMDEQAGDRMTRLLEKRVNDLLILQDAVAMGMQEDPGFLEVLEEKHTDFAIQKYVADHFTLPDTAHPDSMRAYFERYYWKIQIRQLSVRTREQAEEMRAAVVSGSDMGELAKAVSLDTRKLNGGLHNLIYWADLENVFREQVRQLEPGELSEVFPVKEAYAFVRLEKKLPLNETDFERNAEEIRLAVLEKTRQDARREFFERLTMQYPVVVDDVVLETVLADSTKLFTPDFLVDDPAVVLRIPGGPGLTATKLRAGISHEAMKDGTASFARDLERARRQAEHKLVLEHAARELGYFEREDVVERYHADWEEGLLQGYLAETITDRIVFSREEFDEYYEKNKENHRGPDEVRLDILILQDKEQADEAAARLAAGADFGFVWQQYQPAEVGPPGKANFVKETLLSKEIRDELDRMKVGDASRVLDMPMGYMIFVLDARRPGSIPPIQEMEMGIRQVLFEKEFRKLLDEHLSKLKERSEIVRHDEAIEAYFNPDGETR